MLFLFSKSVPVHFCILLMFGHFDETSIYKWNIVATFPFKIVLFVWYVIYAFLFAEREEIRLPGELRLLIVFA